MNSWEWIKQSLRDEPTIIIPIALVLLGLWKVLDILLWAAGLRVVP